MWEATVNEMDDSGATGQPDPRRHPARPVRLGFLGLGWIGRSRLESVMGNPRAVVAAVADPSEEARRAARQLAPRAAEATHLHGLFQLELDGIVIATPSALHAEQARAALNQGLAVYCQKPLARTAAETEAVLAQAARGDRLLGVDFCYRQVAGVERMKELIQSGELGRLFAADLTFHNAYGPDKPWFYDRQLAGGGCLMDLGTHLVDLALWLCDDPEVSDLSGHLYRQGEPLRWDDRESSREVEDAAFAQWTFEGGPLVRMACSWKLSAGCDAVIGATFHGSRGAVSWNNVNGSFYDFVVRHDRGTASRQLAAPPDDWGGRSLNRWVEQLARDPRYDARVERCRKVAQLIDRIYGR